MRKIILKMRKQHRINILFILKAFFHNIEGALGPGSSLYGYRSTPSNSGGTPACFFSKEYRQDSLTNSPMSIS
ncbi:hypothetical protein [Dyadobacter jejuensis]|nr:hypothetical protein [Dyadobacter jejuensis]